MRFPVLKTGAVAQYPARRLLEFRTDLVRFLDGSEQRFRQRGSALKRWVLRLELLDETEMARITDLFRGAQGRAGSFEFEDPWTGQVHPNCSLEIDEMPVELAGEMRAGTVVIIRENRS